MADPSSGPVQGDQIEELLEHTRLRFTGDLETDFRTDYLEKSLTIIRVGLALGIALYSIFGVLDIFIAPLTRHLIWLIRFAIVTPALAFTLVFTWTRLFRRVMEVNMSVVALFAGFGIIAMIALSKDENATRYYYAGLILVLMWAYTFTKLRFVNATIVCWLIVVGYEFTAVVIQNMTSEQESLIVLINNNFFFIAANILGMVINLLMDRYARKDFLRRLLIERNQELLRAERNELLEKNNTMMRELQLARRIQQHMIPQSQPNDRTFSLYKPMDEVGGDYFDFLPLPGTTRLGIFLSDVSGHGVPAAFITSMVKSTVTQATRYQEDPSQMLKHLNTSLVEQIDERFVTAFYGIVDTADRSFVYSSAGHTPPFVCTSTKVTAIRIPTLHIPVGFIDNAEMKQRNIGYANYRTILPRGSKLILYTDGLVEAKNEGAGEREFSNEVEREIYGLRDSSPREFVEGLYAALVEFHGSERFDDDICLICMNIE